MKLLGSDPLQAPEQRIGSGVGAGKEDAQPAKVGGKERIHDARAGEGQSEDRIGAAVAGQKAEAQHLADDQDWGSSCGEECIVVACFHWAALNFKMSPVRMAAKTTPVPAAESQLMTNLAASGLAFTGATGGMRSTRLCSAGMSQ